MVIIHTQTEMIAPRASTCIQVFRPILGMNLTSRIMPQPIPITIAAMSIFGKYRNPPVKSISMVLRASSRAFSSPESTAPRPPVAASIAAVSIPAGTSSCPAPRGIPHISSISAVMKTAGRVAVRKRRKRVWAYER